MTARLRVLRRLVVGHMMRYPGEGLILPADEAAALVAARGAAVEFVVDPAPAAALRGGESGGPGLPADEAAALVAAVEFVVDPAPVAALRGGESGGPGLGEKPASPRRRR